MVARLAASFCALFLLGGCGDLLGTKTTGFVDPSTLKTPANTPSLFNGAMTLFGAAFNGTGAGVGTNMSAVVLSGLLSDELGAAALNNGDVAADSRSVSEAGSGGDSELFTALSQARVAALSAAQVMKGLASPRRASVGELYALTGYVELLIGELYCSGLTLTEVLQGTPTSYGQPLSVAEMLQAAVADLDSAAVWGADSAVVLNLARLGKARALLDLNQAPQAAVVASVVPTSFTFVTEHSAVVQPNRLATGFTAGTYTVSEREGQNGLPLRSAGDPRVRAAFTRKGTDGTTDVWALTTMPAGQATATVLASGVEARLIEAEAALVANPNDASTTGSGWLGILNTLRSTAISPAMPSLPDPGNYAARVDLLFRERGLWLYATAHRQGDLRRLVRQHGRAANTVFPTGSYRGTTTYGSDVTLAPLLVTEARNPNYRGCSDRNP